MASTGRKESPAALVRLTMVNTSTLHGTATVSTAIVIGQMVNAFRPHQAVATDRPPSTSLVFDALEGISSPKAACPSGFARPGWAISGHATLFCRSSARFVHAESFIRTVEDTYGMQEIGFAKSATVLRARRGLSIRDLRSPPTSSRCSRQARLTSLAVAGPVAVEGRPADLGRSN